MGIACKLGFDVDNRPVAASVLVDRRMQAPVLADERRQQPEVRVHQHRQLAPLLDDRDDLVIRSDRAEHLAVGRVAGLALASRVSSSFSNRIP